MSFGGQPQPGSGAPSGQPPGRRPLGAAAVVIAVLVIVVVLGVVAGVVVIAVGGIGPLGRPDPTPATSPSPVGGNSSSPPPVEPPASPLPPVTAANLPTSGDLVWPGSAWHVVSTEPAAHDGPVTPCQQWSPDAPPTRTAILGRSFRLGDTEGLGRAHAYVLSYATVADATTVADAIVADAMSCASRLQGTQGPRMEVSGPLGAGVVTDLQWTDPAGAHVGTYGIAREGNRVVWIWMEAVGDKPDWLGVPEGHPMADSLRHALRRLRVGV